MSGVWRLGRTVVTDPTGLEWTVGRRWLPRPPRWVGIAFRNLRRDEDARAPRLDDDRRSDWWEMSEGLPMLGDVAAAGDDLGGVGAIVAVVVGLVIVVLVAIGAVVVLLPALIFALDLLLVLVLAGLAVAGRVLFHRPWEIVATNDIERAEWAVVGWGASRKAIRHVAAGLRRGTPLGDLHPPLR